MPSDNCYLLVKMRELVIFISEMSFLENGHASFHISKKTCRVQLARRPFVCTVFFSGDFMRLSNSYLKTIIYVYVYKKYAKRTMTKINNVVKTPVVV